MRKNILVVGLVLIGALLLTACAAPEPETIIQTVEVEVAGETVIETVEVPVEVPAEQVEKTVVEFWTTDNEAERVDRYEEVAAKFMEANPDIEVRIVPIEEAGVSQRIATAVAANRLPDIVRMGVERVATLSADGLLDEEAAEAVIASIGEDDFRAGPLAMVTNPTTGMRSAIPYDGWIQALWYRSDVFADLGLEEPVTWDAITEACNAMPGQADLLYGITLGTDPGQNYGHQIFEQVAISNDAWPFDADGNVTFDTPEMIEALAFYASLQECAQPGPQYWRGAREAYEYGTAGMLFYSTYIMDDLVEGSGLEDGSMLEIAVEDLAGNTGFAPSMEGPNGAASYGQLVTLAIMQGADPEAQAVVEFFLTEGYQDILSLASFGKVPVLESAVEEWSASDDLFANYPPETLAAIAAGYDSMQRWLFRPEYGTAERAVIGDIEGRLLIPTVLSNIAIEGTMTPETGAAFLQEQVETMLADRAEE